jgi:hypothetical protein
MGNMRRFGGSFSVIRVELIQINLINKGINCRMFNKIHVVGMAMVRIKILQAFLFICGIAVFYWQLLLK